MKEDLLVLNLKFEVAFIDLRELYEKARNFGLLLIPFLFKVGNKRLDLLVLVTKVDIFL